MEVIRFFYSFTGFADQYFNVGIIEMCTMTIKSRLKIHNKIITGLTFDPLDDLFSVSYDRHICRFNNLALQGRSLVDEEHLPIHIQYCNGFLLVLTDGRQIKMLNPATLNCRKIMRFDGIPRVIILILLFQNTSRGHIPLCNSKVIIYLVLEMKFFGI